MRATSEQGVSKADSTRLMLEDFKRQMQLNNLLGMPEKAAIPTQQRSDMTMMEQLAYPEGSAVEDQFLPDETSYGLPVFGVAALTPAQRAAKANYKKTMQEAAEGAKGGFDKIMSLFKAKGKIRTTDEQRALQEGLDYDLVRQLPAGGSDLMQHQMRQKALKDTIEGREFNKEARALGSDTTKSGLYFGSEPLEDTVVKSASFHPRYAEAGLGEEIQRYPATNDVAETARKFGGSTAEDVREAIRQDALRRMKADDILAAKGFAPQSMMVDTPRASYIVQDKADESIGEAMSKESKILTDEIRRIEGAAMGGVIPMDESRKIIEDLREARSRSRLKYEALHDSLRDRIKKETGLIPDDFHTGNVWTQKGNPVVVDTQNFGWYDPTDLVYDRLPPIEENHWRVIKKK